MTLNKAASVCVLVSVCVQTWSLSPLAPNLPSRRDEAEFCTKFNMCLLPFTEARFIANTGTATPGQKKKTPGWAGDKKGALSSRGPARPSGYILPQLYPLVLRIQLLLNSFLKRCAGRNTEEAANQPNHRRQRSQTIPIITKVDLIYFRQ